MFALLVKLETGILDSDALIVQVREELVPVLRNLAGFERFEVVDTRDGTLLLLGAFDTLSGAEDAARLAKGFASRRLGDVAVRDPAATLGEVVVASALSPPVRSPFAAAEAEPISGRP